MKRRDEKNSYEEHRHFGIPKYVQKNYIFFYVCYNDEIISVANTIISPLE
jgi:hypothetical protein